MSSGKVYAAGLYIWAAVGWGLRTVGYMVGESIDAACELFDLDGEDH